MKNADKPAMPISEEETDRFQNNIDIFVGFTKREMIAMNILTGLVSKDDRTCTNYDKVRHSVSLADALLIELEGK